ATSAARHPRRRRFRQPTSRESSLRILRGSWIGLATGAAEGSARPSPSERNIVFHVVELAGGLLHGQLGLGGLALGGLGVGALARGLARLARLAGAGARTQHLHDVAANLGAVAILPLL